MTERQRNAYRRRCAALRAQIDRLDKRLDALNERAMALIRERLELTRTLAGVRREARTDLTFLIEDRLTHDAEDAQRFEDQPHLPNRRPGRPPSIVLRGEDGARRLDEALQRLADSQP